MQGIFGWVRHYQILEHDFARHIVINWINLLLKDFSVSTTYLFFVFVLITFLGIRYQNLSQSESVSLFIVINLAWLFSYMCVHCSPANIISNSFTSSVTTISVLHAIDKERLSALNKEAENMAENIRCNSNKHCTIIKGHIWRIALPLIRNNLQVTHVQLLRGWLYF